MAQEKRGETSGKDSEYEFTPEEFDEDAFIHREMVSFRTTAILFGVGIVAALVSWAAFGALGGTKTAWLAGLGICAAFGVALKWIYPALKADIKHFGRREWLGTGALFFFTWLAFFLIAINPPVSDFAPPHVEIRAAPYAQDPTGAIAVHVFFEDNVGVESHDFQLAQGGQVLATQADLVSLGRGHYLYTLDALVPGTYQVTASATDARGHEGDGAFEFTVSEGLVDYSATGGGVLSGPADRVLVKTDVPACKTSKGTVTTRDPCIRTVRLAMASGSNVTLRYSKEETAWIGTTALAGWAPGNNTFDVVAELADQWVGSIRIDGGAIESGPHSLDVRGGIGAEVVEPAEDPGQVSRNVPGLGLPLLAAGVLAVAVLLRRRQP